VLVTTGQIWQIDFKTRDILVKIIIGEMNGNMIDGDPWFRILFPDGSSMTLPGSWVIENGALLEE
jgi:hypothetical protein